MSSPDVNIEKQKKRHIGPLVGLVVCAAAVVAIAFALNAPDEEGGSNDASAATGAEISQ
jgi:hypothetical protein